MQPLWRLSPMRRLYVGCRASLPISVRSSRATMANSTVRMASGSTADVRRLATVTDAPGTFSQHALMASMFGMSQAGVVIARATMLVSELLIDWSSKYAEPIGKILGARSPTSGSSRQDSIIARQSKTKRAIARKVIRP